ncbi:hypothetical protein N7533_001491 [Penicillium manginii]|uniref:uncharacterized protein n=1 Tax=Penicillium manginii TaxID=203109 RepID=UPI0025490ED3|nr:uncharacterized protein N7533_001491 [Penicillium manginii]KAJ5762810.1 hypothetical protein N7533_001491 [Penicillium manginii]
MEYPISRFWFGPASELIKAGKVIQLKDPMSRWKIERLLSEREHRIFALEARNNCPSYVSVKMQCSKDKEPTTKAFMRVFLQIPHKDTAFAPIKELAKHARQSYLPRELEAFQLFSKDDSASKCTPRLIGSLQVEQGRDLLVPGGFLIYYVWEKVSGIRLGDYTGKARWFWDIQSKKERELIREKFEESFNALRDVGILPEFASANNLVWNLQTQTLYWIGFRDWSETGREKPMTEEWYFVFDLMRVPSGSPTPLDRKYNGNKKEWIR